MNFYDYIGLTPEQFEKVYLSTRLVNSQTHPTFPLVIYTYGRETVYKQAWNAVTTKCRGIIVNRETGEIVARPFEKFFNFGDPINGMTDTAVDMLAPQAGQPVVWEKVDGFLCIGYNWGGKWYCASKGSFTSPHAKWASAQIQRLDMDFFPTGGYTPVFEGICPSLRIVVDYGANEELILTAIIHNDTGIEMPPPILQSMGDLMGASTPELETLSWQEVQQATYDETVKNAEGYVLTWYRAGMTPYRLKAKYIDYLRIHRMVTGVSPKRVLEALQNGWTSVLEEWTNQSTPWFNTFVAKWRRVIEVEAMRLEQNAKDIYDGAQNIVDTSYDEPAENLGETRKRWAEVFTAPDNKEYSGILFAMLDGKDWRQVIWKKIKESAIMKNGHPLVDAHNT